MTPVTQRASVYIRVSTEEQRLGPGAQLEACERWAESHDVEIVATSTDHGLSGTLPMENRPGLLDAVALVAAGEAGILLVAKVDRIARDIIVSATVERAVRQSGGRIVSADGVGNDTGPESEFMRTILGAMAQYERAMIVMRTRSALAVKRRAGKRYTHHAPYGYTWRRGEMVPDPVEMRARERARELRDAGVTLRRIGRMLEAEGFKPRGNQWHTKSVQALLRSW